eukprot:TRINITY_DN11153_c0_g1_i1.p1 TRINITY_DN11153_c0_g1~~TRINITY_DN11153_c0_g1_i1.p1  ORF type:complete len:197 (+),score=25.18 TRINITY_DN11153_c0_g1_i1:60-650(+)
MDKNASKVASEEDPYQPPEGAGFAVDFKSDCPHMKEHLNITPDQLKSAYHSNKCHSCNDNRENWVCLHCGTVSCSRYVRGHASQHGNDQKHYIGLSFSDLSFWCYECDEYLKARPLLPFYRAAQEAKFSSFSHPAPSKPKSTGDSYFVCNNCFKKVPDVVHHCQECSDFDLCNTCYTNDSFAEPHKKSHKMSEVRL